MGTSKKYGVSRTTLRERFLGNQGSRQAAISEHYKNLTDAEEDALISLINRLTNRGLPSTNSMVKNLAEEVIQRFIGKNWSNQSIARQKHRLISGFLYNIDKK